MRVGRFLVQGVDVWLNNPRRPLEASGTSGHEGGPERRPERQRPRRLVGRGLRRRQRLGDRRSRSAGPTRPPRTGTTPRTSTACSRRRSSRATTSVTRTACPLRWLTVMRRAMASALWRFSTTRMLHEYTERLYLPAAGVAVAEGGDGAARDRSRLGPPDGAAHLARPRDPQPPAGRQLRLGLRRGLRRRPTCRCSRRSSGIRASASPSTTRARCSSGCGPSGPTSSTGCAALVDRGQVEILGGGYYEPVLASLPERDRIGQLARMGDELEALFGRRPSGAWLAERVWEPDLPTSLAAGGYDWTDPRRRPLPRGRDPRGGPLGPVHDRGPGPAPDGLRDRAGPALPDPVPRRGGRHRLPPRPRHRGRRRGSG